MGFNAKEVVRVFACTTHLSYNLSRMKYTAVSTPFKKALFDMRPEVSQVKDTIRWDLIVWTFLFLIFI